MSRGSSHLAVDEVGGIRTRAVQIKSSLCYRYTTTSGQAVGCGCVSNASRHTSLILPGILNSPEVESNHRRRLIRATCFRCTTRRKSDLNHGPSAGRARLQPGCCPGDDVATTRRSPALPHPASKRVSLVPWFIRKQAHQPVGREALESSSTVLQTIATPSQLPTQVWPTKKPDVVRHRASENAEAYAECHKRSSN